MIPGALETYWKEQAQKPAEHDANGWSERSQVVRLLAAIERCDPQPGETVCDWGCGTGRLLDFIPSGVRYLGIDPSQAMIDRAIRERPENYADFVCSPALPKASYDHVLAIGPWNVAPWELAWTRAQIEQLWTRTRKTLICSLLRVSGDDRAVTYGPLHVAQWAVLLSRRWSVDCTILDHDVMLVVER